MVWSAPSAPTARGPSTTRRLSGSTTSPETITVSWSRTWAAPAKAALIRISGRSLTTRRASCGCLLSASAPFTIPSFLKVEHLACHGVKLRLVSLDEYLARKLILIQFLFSARQVYRQRRGHHRLGLLKRAVRLVLIQSLVRKISHSSLCKGSRNSSRWRRGIVRPLWIATRYRFFISVALATQNVMVSSPMR